MDRPERIALEIPSFGSNGDPDEKCLREVMSISNPGCAANGA
jgi:hypothetical protein